MLRHIASAHYKEILSQKYLKDGKECRLCGKTSVHLSDLLGHVASVHNGLKDMASQFFSTWNTSSVTWH